MRIACLAFIIFIAGCSPAKQETRATPPQPKPVPEVRVEQSEVRIVYAN